MMYVRTLAAIVLLLSPLTLINAQVMINEGSNRNYSMLADEDGEFPDWIELYNSGSDTVNLIGYALTDDEDVPAKWVFPNTKLAPGEYRIIYCSGKDRKPLTAFNTVANSGTFTPVTGWNSHAFDNPFYWDGVSNVLVNICSYSSLGYTSNSVFNQSQLPFYATTMAWQDGSEASCSSHYGFKSNFRPNVKLDNHTIGEATNQNSPFDYPAPYGNWYWCSRTQFLITASEMSAADMSAGNIDSLSFDVVSTDANTVYDYIEISLKLVGKPEVTNEFEVLNSTINLHTNFKLAKKGETVYLFNPEGQLVSHLDVNCVNLDSSVGSLPDGSTHEALFSESTPEQTNNSSAENIGYLNAPLIETPAGLYNSVVKVNLTNPNEIPSTLYYTLDGSDPDVNSAVYDGTPITIYYSAVLKARVLADQVMPSPVSSASYLLGINHTTPILSVVTDRNNLFGPDGIFDHWDLEVEKEAHVEYYDTDHQLVFSKVAGMQVDGGLGGSRASPQHSFRIDFDHPVLGDKAIDYSFISTKPNHKTYSSIYLRNGSNQYLTYPYKDACAVEAMGEGTHNYYAGYTPVTVYINGTYFGLYELREKFNDDFYEAYDGADPDSMDLLSQSAYYFFVLRALKGSVDPFYAAVDSVKAIDPADSVFWDKADRFFDLTYYTDYIIAQSWIGNTDWPGNNIKIYRSDKTGFRWRFGIQDFELALEPNSWTNAAFNSIDFLQMQDGNNPYISLWQRGMQNERFRKYFINRFADLMNTNYKPEKLLAIENRMFAQTVVEMPKEYGRWGDANNVAGQMDNFIKNHNTYRAELSQRSE
ncbi:MAG: CotH kinase family protein, partial [Saprospiraceae bacterium]